MKHLFDLLKFGGVAIGTLVAAHTLLWSLGLAFVTNNQAERMVKAGIEEFRKDVFEDYKKTHFEFHRKRNDEVDARVNKIADDFHSIQTTVGVLDERTKQILDSVRSLKR